MPRLLLALSSNWVASIICVFAFAVDFASQAAIVYGRLRSSPSASATATEIVSAWTSMPRNLTFSFTAGSSPLVALICAAFRSHRLTHTSRREPVTLQKLQTAKSGMGAKLKCSSAAFLESHFNCCPLNLASYAAMPWSMYWEPYFTMR